MTLVVMGHHAGSAFFPRERGLPAERIEQLLQIAQARGVEPSVLARQWVIDQLDAAQHARDQAQERWERDLRATTDHLRQLLDERPGA